MDLLGAKQVSEMIGVPVGTLRYWRHSDIGPASFTLGRRVVYRRDEVLRWISERENAPALRSLGWAIEDDGARNHRNVLLWTICPPQQDSTPERASQSSRPSLLQRSAVPSAEAGIAPTPFASGLFDEDLAAEAS